MAIIVKRVIPYLKTDSTKIASAKVLHIDPHGFCSDYPYQIVSMGYPHSKHVCTLSITTNSCDLEGQRSRSLKVTMRKTLYLQYLKNYSSY